jgi:hypothetical protein
LSAGQGPDTLRQLKDRCLAAKAQGRSADEEAAHNERLHRARSCRTWTDRDGTFRLDARLAPDAGASLLATLKAETDRVFALNRKAGIRERPNAYAADALVALVTGIGILGASGLAGSGLAGSGVGDDNELDAGSGGGTGSGLDGSGGTTRRRSDPKAVVHLRVDLDALRNGVVGPTGTCEIPGVGPVSIQHARALMGDAIFKLVIARGIDVHTVVNLGRHVPEVLKTALLERDRACVVPGCDRIDRLEKDHRIVAYVDDGEVSMENLAKLCHYHHYLKTHKGFQILGEPGNWHWVPPKRAKGSDLSSMTADPSPALFTNPALFTDTE